MTPMEKRLHEDNVIFDMPTEEIIGVLLSEGHGIFKAIRLVEETQNVTVSTTTNKIFNLHTKRL